MGQQSSKQSELRRAIRSNDAALVEVELRSVLLSDSAIRKLTDALRKNE